MSDLNFDKVEPPPAADAASSSPQQPLACVVCKRAVQGSYFEINGKIVDANCKARVEASRTSGSPSQRFLVAGALGLGAAIVGGIGYGAFTLATGWNIGIIAIAVGWFVGLAVRKGSGMRGGRGYQFLAAALTYLAVGGGSVPILMGKDGNLVVAVMFMFVGPILEPIMSFPSGLIGLAITFFGISQAWRMNATPAWDVKGPFSVADAAASPVAAP